MDLWGLLEVFTGLVVVVLGVFDVLGVAGKALRKADATCAEASFVTGADAFYGLTRHNTTAPLGRRWPSFAGLLSR